MIERSVLELIQNEALIFALYTIENRAIPNMIDGLKPVHRFFIASAMKGGGNFRKVAAVGGNVAELGYHHAEGAANDSGSLLCASWANNVPFLVGQGFFGSRLIQKPSAARYIYCKPSPEFNLIYQDMDLCPVHPDEEHEPPSHYLPIIPTVLLNGIVGIAKAYATSIPPHSIESLIKGCIAHIKGKNFSLDVQYPKFTGDIIDGTMYGKYELVGKTKLIITEIPYKFDREKYMEVLISLKEKGSIIDYVEESKDDFRFTIQLKREYANNLTKEKIIADFKLSENINPNINVIKDGKLIHFDSTEDLLKSFVDYRKIFYAKRIEKRIKDTQESLNKANADIAFITYMLKHPDCLKHLSRAGAVDFIANIEGCSDHAEQLINMKFYHLTIDEVEKLRQKKEELFKELEHWKTTTVDEVYLGDLSTLLKKMKK